MRKFQKSINTALTLAMLTLPLSAAVAANPYEPPEGIPRHERTLQLNEQSLTGQEQTLAKMEATKEDTARNLLAVTYEQQQMVYVNAMQGHHDAAVRQFVGPRHERHERGGPRHERHERHEKMIAQLNEFEQLAQRHERRTMVLSKRAEAMATGRQTSYWQLEDSLTRGVSGAFAAVHEFMFPSAHAAIALTVYNACKKDSNGNVNQAACAAAAAKALTDSNTARNNFNACWNSYANTKPNWVRALRRAVCTAVLIARLA